MVGRSITCRDSQACWCWVAFKCPERSWHTFMSASSVFRKLSGWENENCRILCQTKKAPGSAKLSRPTIPDALRRGVAGVSAIPTGVFKAHRCCCLLHFVATPLPFRPSRSWLTDQRCRKFCVEEKNVVAKICATSCQLRLRLYPKMFCIFVSLPVSVASFCDISLKSKSMWNTMNQRNSERALMCFSASPEKYRSKR